MKDLVDMLRRNIDAVGVTAACLAVFLGSHAFSAIHHVGQQASACGAIQPALQAIGFF